MIVDHLAVKVRKITSQLERFRCRKNVSRCFGRRICRKRDVEGTIANHVEQDPAAELFGAGALELSGKIPASVQSIRLRKMIVRFFAVEKHELNLRSEIWMLPDYSRQFQEQACARAAVVSSYELYSIKRFRVVMRAQQKQGRRVSLAVKLGNQIHERDLSPRGVVGECVGFYLPARTVELVLDIVPGFFDSLGSRRARPEIDQLLNMRESFHTRNLLPDFCLRRARYFRIDNRRADNQE